MKEILNNCPICKNDQLTKYMDTKDYMLSDEIFTITKCINCQFLFTNPRPDKTNIIKYYKSDEYISHTDKPKNIVQLLYKLIRNYTLSTKYKLIRKYSNLNTIMDYGCGTGDFLNYLNKKKINTIGIEPDVDAIKIAKSKGLEIYNSHQSISKKVDVITLWHVLEHIHTLNETIEELKKLLKKNGLLIIAVPNNKSFDSQFYKQYWAAWDLPRHLYHFDHHTIQKLFENHQMTLIDSKPMYFDSFYVSLLSEKYKTKKQNLSKAFLLGLKSNIKALKTNNYSSTIYIFKK